MQNGDDTSTIVFILFFSPICFLHHVSLLPSDWQLIVNASTQPTSHASLKHSRSHLLQQIYIFIYINLLTSNVGHTVSTFSGPPPHVLICEVQVRDAQATLTCMEYVWVSDASSFLVCCLHESSSLSSLHRELLKPATCSANVMSSRWRLCPTDRPVQS